MRSHLREQLAKIDIRVRAEWHHATVFHRWYLHPQNSGVCVKLHLRHKQADDKNRIWCIFALKMWHLVAKIVIISLIINWRNFVYLQVDPVFLLPLLEFLWRMALYPPIRWTPLTYTTDIQIGRQTCLFVLLCFRWSLILSTQPNNHAKTAVKRFSC